MQFRCSSEWLSKGFDSRVGSSHIFQSRGLENPSSWFAVSREGFKNRQRWGGSKGEAAPSPAWFLVRAYMQDSVFGSWEVTASFQ